jgi:6-phosphogluconolactonase/glucosamine-6-phosphate isomerase/deaminase
MHNNSADNNIWITKKGNKLNFPPAHTIHPVVLPDEKAVGLAMFSELRNIAESRVGDINIALLGGRGAQALHRHLGELAQSSSIDGLLSRLNVFTQDALAPMQMNNGLSFVRDFERLLGPYFFKKIKSFTPMKTETDDIRRELDNYLYTMNELGGLDIFFLGHGPEAEGASHLAYIKPGSGAGINDIAGIIPISQTILEHHISKFKAGGSSVSAEDEEECRKAKYILTLGPAAILGAKKIVQSVVDADTASEKKVTYKKVIETSMSNDLSELAKQLDLNPGLWVRLHQNVVSYVLPNVIE